MQRITKRALIGLGVILVLLLALGALPGFLKSGDPYYVTAEPTNATLPGENATVIDAANLSDRTYRYTWAALRDADAAAGNGSAGDAAIGRSDPYWKGYVGLKEAFTHSPFDEMGALRARNPSAFVAEDAALVRWRNQTYRLALVGG